MSIANDSTEVTTVELDEGQGRALFERSCQDELGVAAETFLAAHDAGTYPTDWDDKAIQRVEFLIPFGR